MRRLAPWLVIAAAAAAFLAPLDAHFIEKWYSTRLYIAWQPVVTGVSNGVPLALFDVILIGTLLAVGAILVSAWRARRTAPRWRTAATVLRRCATLTAALYLWFVVVWGFNYRRVPLLERLELVSTSTTAEAVATLGRRAVDELNRLHGPAHGAGWSDPFRDNALRDAYRRTQSALTPIRAAHPGRFKTTLLGTYFRWASVDGMIDPFALEVLPNPDLLPFEQPFVAAHEWAHLAGYANEAEASFVGFVTCMTASVPAQYSGWLFLYWEVTSAVSAEQRRSLDATVHAGPRADIAAVVERVRRGQLPTLRMASWAAYDQYLKANHVEEGVRSYDEVLTLLTRARFADGWTPVPARVASAGDR